MQTSVQPSDERSLNSLLNHEESSKGQIILKSRPRMLFLELTRSCNLACPMCRPEILSGKHLAMSNDVLARVESELFPYVDVVDLRGWGESTLDNRLLDIIDYLVSSGVKTKILTNLSARTPEYWRNLGRKDILVGISLEAAGDSYERYRKGAKLHRFLANLEALRDEQLKRQAINSIYFNIVVSDENIQELVDIIQFAADYSVPLITLNPITLPDENTIYPKIGVSNEKVEDLRSALIAARHLGNSKGIELRVGANLACGYTDVGGYDLCLHPWSYVFVRYDGGVGFCDHLIAHNDSIFGNLRESSFMNIWNGDAYRQLRREHVSHKFERLHNLGIECDWCYKNRYTDCEYMIEPSRKPLSLTNLITIESLFKGAKKQKV